MQYGFIQSGGGADGISQGSITFDVTGLTAGATYNVSFFAALRFGFLVDPIAVSFGAQALGTFTPLSVDAFTSFTSGTFTAIGSTGSLEFLGTATAGDFDSAIDAVVVNALNGPPVTVAAVPEPASIVLLGLGLLGGVLVRRRSAVSKQA